MKRTDLSIDVDVKLKVSTDTARVATSLLRIYYDCDDLVVASLGDLTKVASGFLDTSEEITDSDIQYVRQELEQKCLIPWEDKDGSNQQRQPS